MRMPSWWNSLHVVSWLSWIARGAGVLSTALIFIFGWREFTLGKLGREAEKKQEAKDKRDADTRIASAQLGAAEANKKVEEAKVKQMEIAQQNMTLSTNLAKVQIEAANAKRALLELQQRAMPRTVNESQSVIALLKSTPGVPVHLEYMGSDSEAYNLASQIRNILHSSGWNVKKMDTVMRISTGGPQSLSVEVNIDERSSAWAICLVRALRLAGLNPEPIATADARKGEASIYVGAKSQVR